MNIRLVALRPSGWWQALLFVAALVPASLAETNLERTRNGGLSAGLRTVQVDHRLGPVTITGVDQDFGWRWVFKCGGDSQEADAYLKETELEVRETPGTLSLRLVLPERRSLSIRSTTGFLGLFSWMRSSSRGINLNSELELRVPKAVAVELKNRFGASKVTALSGSVRVQGQNGRVDLADLSGAVTASTSFGAMHAERIGASTLNNQNGNVDVAGATGDLKVGTSFGRMNVRDVTGRTDLKNQNGHISAERIDGDLLASTSFARLEASDIKGRAELKNQNGAIVAQRVGGDIVAASSFGEVHVDHVAGKASLSCRNGKIEANHVGGDVTAANTFAPLRVRDVRGRADLEAQNGDLAASEIDGDIRAKTSFAKMELDSASKRFDARNQNGPVQITARSPAVQRIAATASFAPIDVRLSGDVQPLIRATTSFGKVRSEYPVLLADTFSDAKFYAESNQPKIDLRGQNGDIRIQPLAAR